MALKSSHIDLRPSPIGVPHECFPLFLFRLLLFVLHSEQIKRPKDVSINILSNVSLLNTLFFLQFLFFLLLLFLLPLFYSGSQDFLDLLKLFDT